MPESIRFSIIIPTRDRCDTLEATLRTCLSQEYANTEIIISDNFSSDNTKAFISQLNHPNLKYINTNKRISMSENWDFALQFATGDYITILGDDDGLLPGALSKIEKILRKTSALAITWRQASYHWPNHIIPNERNFIAIPLSTNLEKRNVSEYLNRVLNFEISYDEISFFYKGMIHKSIVDKVKQISGGKFFHSQTPDLYAAIALSSNLEEYYFSGLPFSINGASASSNGTSQFNQNISTTEYDKFSSESNVPFHHQLRYCASIPMLIAECFYQASDRIPTLKQHFHIEPEKLITATLNDALSSPKWRFKQISQASLETIDINKWGALLKNANSIIASYHEISPVKKLRYGFLKRENLICIDGAKFLVHNVYDASLLCNFVIHHKNAGLTIDHTKFFLERVRYKFSRIQKKISKLF